MDWGSITLKRASHKVESVKGLNSCMESLCVEIAGLKNSTSKARKPAR